MDQKNYVSIITPFYNAAEFIGDAIDSVLNQTHNNWELILINDGSNDDSLAILGKYINDDRITLLNHPGNLNRGVAKSRELGVQKAKGDFISFLDSDDIFYPTKLEEQLEVFSRFKEVILVHSKVEILDDFNSNFNNDFNLDKNDKLYELYEQKSWLDSNTICNSTVLVEATILKGIRFGLPQLFQFEDWLLWSLIADKGSFYYQNIPLIKYRVHPTSATGAILKNRLIYPYSKIEFLISLYSLIESNTTRSILIVQLRETLVRLLEIYSNNNVKKVNSFTSDLDSPQINKEFYIKKYEILLNKYSNLKKEKETIEEIKNSRSFKLISKLKNIMKLIR